LVRYSGLVVAGLVVDRSFLTGGLPGKRLGTERRLHAIPPVGVAFGHLNRGAASTTLMMALKKTLPRGARRAGLYPLMATQ